MGANLSKEQVEALNRAVVFNMRRRTYEQNLGVAVREARALGVPLNTLARCMDVSRNRVRVLARPVEVEA